jgi:formiminotetrahydrofolate cyclodeaminase
MLRDLTIQDFTTELASKSPAPGGGSVAALSGALASALTCMVFNLTVGRKDYNEYPEHTKDSIDSGLSSTGTFKDDFLDLMEKDVEAFMELMGAFKLPKAEEAEARFRSEKIREGYKKALEIPLEVAESALKIFEHIETAARWGNKNAASDAGVAAILAQSAIEGAVLNVRINLGSIKDEDYKAGIAEKCEKLTARGQKKKDEIMVLVNRSIT